MDTEVATKRCLETLMQYCYKAQTQKMTLRTVGHSKCLLGKSFTFKGPNKMTGTGTFVEGGYQVQGYNKIITNWEEVYQHVCNIKTKHGRPQTFVHISELDMTLEEFKTKAGKWLAKRKGNMQDRQEAAAGSTAPPAAQPSASCTTAAAAGTSTSLQPAAAGTSAASGPAPVRPPAAARERAAPGGRSASMTVPPLSGKAIGTAAATPPTAATLTAAAAVQRTAQRSAQRLQQRASALVATPAAAPARPPHGAHSAAGTSPPPAPLLRRQRPADAHAAAAANTAAQEQLESEFQDFLRKNLLAEDDGDVHVTRRQLQDSSLPLEAFTGVDPGYLINGLPALPASSQSGDEDDGSLAALAKLNLQQGPAPAASQLGIPAAARAAGVTAQAQPQHCRQQQQQPPSATPAATPALLAAPSSPSSASLGRRWSKFLLAAKRIHRASSSDAADPLTAAARAVHHHRAQLLPLAGLPEKAEAIECLLDWLEQLVVLLQDDAPAAEDVQVVLESLASVARVYGIKPCTP